MFPVSANPCRKTSELGKGGWPTHSKPTPNYIQKKGAPPFRVLCGGWDAIPPEVTAFPKTQPTPRIPNPQFPFRNSHPNFPHYSLDFTLRYIKQYHYSSTRLIKCSQL